MPLHISSDAYALILPFIHELSTVYITLLLFIIHHTFMVRSYHECMMDLVSRMGALDGEMAALAGLGNRRLIGVAGWSPKLNKQIIVIVGARDRNPSG